MRLSSVIRLSFCHATALFFPVCGTLIFPVTAELISVDRPYIRYILATARIGDPSAC